MHDAVSLALDGETCDAVKDSFNFNHESVTLSSKGRVFAHGFTYVNQYEKYGSYAFTGRLHTHGELIVEEYADESGVLREFNPMDKDALGLLGNVQFVKANGCIELKLSPEECDLLRDNCGIVYSSEDDIV